MFPATNTTLTFYWMPLVQDLVSTVEGWWVGGRCRGLVGASGSCTFDQPPYPRPSASTANRTFPDLLVVASGSWHVMLSQNLSDWRADLERFEGGLAALADAAALLQRGAAEVREATSVRGAAHSEGPVMHAC